MLSFKTNLRYSKKCAKNNDMINKFFFKKKWLILKMSVKMKNRSYRNDINRTKPIHDYDYTKYKLCLSMMMVICNK